MSRRLFACVVGVFIDDLRSYTQPCKGMTMLQGAMTVHCADDMLKISVIRLAVKGTFRYQYQD